MFVYTARFSRKKAVLAGIVTALIILGIILFISLRSAGFADAASGGVKTNEDRVSYLTSLGWIVDSQPIDSRDIVIPRSFDGVYAEYLSLQNQQGYPLEEYGGMEATRYTYKVRNWSGSEADVVADIIVCGQSVIAGDIQSTALDGFMTRLKPESSTTSGS